MNAPVHIADDYTQSQMIGLGITFVILPILAVGLRVWAKLLGPRRLAGDDLLIFFAVVGCRRETLRATRLNSYIGFCHRLWSYRTRW